MPLRNIPRRRVVLGLIALATVTATLAQLPHTAVGKAKAPKVFTGIVRGVAVGGYDPVAYFTQDRAVRGSKDITLRHDGAIWRFSSNENKAAFAAAPQEYAPAYGGHCSWAVSRGYTAKGDPNAWRIVGGRLFLNYNKKVQQTWERNISSNVSKADRKWPQLVAE